MGGWGALLVGSEEMKSSSSSSSSSKMSDTFWVLLIVGSGEGCAAWELSFWLSLLVSEGLEEGASRTSLSEGGGEEGSWTEWGIIARELA